MNTHLEPAPCHDNDPVGLLLSDPETHFSDINYVYFRQYKKRLIYELTMAGLQDVVSGSEPVTIVDIGASMGFDLLYIVRRLKKDGHSSLIPRLRIHFLEGDDALKRAGESLWKNAGTNVQFEFCEAYLTEPLPVSDGTVDMAICSEVVEHMEQPDLLLAAIFRMLKPGGTVVFTTDNSPSLPQYIRRIPRWITGSYNRYYGPLPIESEIVGSYERNGKTHHIYGHISLKPTWKWETIARQCGFKVIRYGTYQSIRRGGAGHRPITLAVMFAAGFVNSCLPRSLGRYFGDTTALLLQKPPV